ncbi:restriction endonuclease [Achromobacter xylosoxidans]|uniref:restriction endonuclease n=1 Tax=Alcaligenes xylosoxydans xylosoxydans TaxID=85698 RepID=UPI00292E616C|nr:restriction endonuclease [Achromobacter xylosoxidans]WOB74641.1 restriction endonuclease [Achromobacter xylosoxidans]
MKIFDQAPRNWKELQNLVGQLFEEMGCEVQIGQKVKLLRGKKEIDVRVVDNVMVPPSHYLCECKHWGTRVKLETIHAFRTVMDEQGANRGFIISRSGFQSGAHTAVKNTNTSLFTFEELQATFFDRWRQSMAKRYSALAEELSIYWDPCRGKLPARKFGPNDLQVMALLQETNQPLIALTPSVVQAGGVLPLPMTIPVLDEAFTKIGELTLTSYRQFYEWIDTNKERAVAGYRRHMGLDASNVHVRSMATDAIEAGILPPLPPFNALAWKEAEDLAAAQDLVIQELRLSERNVHRGQHLRFVRTDGKVWHALRDSMDQDDTPLITACVNGAVLRCHESDDGEGTHQFIVWEFVGRQWKLAIGVHSMAFDEELELTQLEIDNPW